MDSSKFARRTLLLTGVGLLCVTCFAFETALEKTKLDAHDTHDIDIYIEQKLGYIHAKIDLTPTIKGVAMLEKFIYRLDKGSSDTLGGTLAALLRKRLERIESKIVRVSGKKSLERSKRSIEIIGDLISDLFGNPGPSDWKKNAANILALQNAMKRLNENSMATHLDIDSDRHNIELNNNQIRELNKMITRGQVELANISAEMVSLKTFFEISELAEAIEHQVNYLVEVRRDSLKGFCNDRALDKDFLIENLQNLEANKVGLSPIFNSWEWREYYKYDMCSVALDNESVWITLRIPLVRKAEKLVRVIPLSSQREILVRIESYGLDVVLFRERNNDKFHVMTKSSLDFCINLGKIKSCSVRDARFGLTSNAVMPVEFALNRFLLVSHEPVEIKLMGKCPSGVTEHSFTTDRILLVPVNCSFIGKEFTIDVRESDSVITRELRIVHFDKLVVEPVKNYHLNSTYTSFVAISNRTNHLNFANNKKDIDDMLQAIDTKHSGLWESYRIEKWLFAGTLAGLVIIYISVKIARCILTKRQGKLTAGNLQCKRANHDIELQDLHGGQLLQLDTDKVLPTLQLHPSMTQQQQLQQRPQQHTQTKADISGAELAANHVYTEVSDGKINFGLPPESSQFYQK